MTEIKRYNNTDKTIFVVNFVSAVNGWMSMIWWQNVGHRNPF